MSGRLSFSTLTPGQERYIRANYNRMTQAEMASNINISQWKVCENMRVMKLRPTRRQKRSIPVYIPANGFFNVEAYARSIVTI